MYERDAGCCTKCWQLKSNDCGNGNHLEKHLSGLPWQTLSARSQGRKSTHANLQRNFSFLRTPPFTAPSFCSHCFFVWVCDKEMHKSKENVQLLVKFKWRDYTAARTPRLCRLIRFVLHSHHFFCLSHHSLLPLPIAGGPWDEWYTAVLWSEAGGRHLPDCETAVVEGSTGSRIRDLGQKTSWAGKLHSDCMSAEAWPCHQNHLHLATSRHRSPISPLKSTSHFHKKISTGRCDRSHD